MNKSLPSTPVLRAGCGDNTEKDLIREREYVRRFNTPVRHKTTTSSPVSKLTARDTRSKNGYRVIQEYYKTPLPTPLKTKQCKSMEDLSKKKRGLTRTATETFIIKRPATTLAQREAAVKIFKWLLLNSYRKRRSEVGYLKKSVAYQSLNVEKYRIQTITLKNILDADSDKVRIALREIANSKKEINEKNALNEKLSRERDDLLHALRLAEDRVRTLEINLDNSSGLVKAGNEKLAETDDALRSEKTMHLITKGELNNALKTVNYMMNDINERDSLLDNARVCIENLQLEVRSKEELVECKQYQLDNETALRSVVEQERDGATSEVSRLEDELASVREQLAALRLDQQSLLERHAAVVYELSVWPRPLTRVLTRLSLWMRHPSSMRQAVMWLALPSRHGCW